jgi:uncharacterized protein YdaU (DUF1376 family)
MTAELPPPLVAAEIDLRDMDGFMLNVERLMASELWALSTPEEFKAALALWCRAWKQLPAASLPDDPRVLAAFAGVSAARWRKLAPVAMRGFVLCADGRHYHRVLAEDARRAWERKLAFRARGKLGNERRWGKPDPSAIENDRQTQEQRQEPEQGQTSRGCRLPEDFALTAELSGWALNELGAAPALVHREFAKFTDYWRAQPGAKGRKLDWSGTWRNWMRRACEQQGGHHERVAVEPTNGAGTIWDAALQDAVLARRMGAA